MQVLFVLVSPHALDGVGPVEGIFLLAGLAMGAAYMAWIGYGLFRGSQILKNPLEAAATVNKLYETGGGCYADISFKDVAGVQRATTIGMMQKIWKYLKVGGTISISYEAGNPNQARYGGQAAQAVYAIAGFTLMAIGSALSLMFVVLLVVGWMGQVNKEPERRQRRRPAIDLPKMPKMPESPKQPPPPPTPPR
jgi:hypothetical protein